MTMMIYDMTLQHQAERRMSAAEQRRADEQLGRMAARTSALWRRATRPFRLTAGQRPRLRPVTASNAREC
jgi:hypothetical protein